MRRNVDGYFILFIKTENDRVLIKQIPLEDRYDISNIANELSKIVIKPEFFGFFEIKCKQ